MAKFRKKPVIIEAVQFDNKFLNGDKPEWIIDALAKHPHETGAMLVLNDSILIATLEGIMTASPTDYIIQGVKGEIYPCKDDIFNLTYEEV